MDICIFVIDIEHVFRYVYAETKMKKNNNNNNKSEKYFSISLCRIDLFQFDHVFAYTLQIAFGLLGCLRDEISIERFYSYSITECVIRKHYHHFP